ncbi:MAG TPA: M15 family metallopeptidase [Steroidobacteraceae bacterium]|nr:M15 family metallopeptidase [Steroidobacteraceae bacterium]
MNELELTGRARTHIAELDDPRCALHREAVQPFLDMRSEATAAGFDLTPVSSFRDFDTQLRIWNEKYRGERALYGRDGRRLEHAALNETELVDAMLCWSAMPGASRHHWGTEIDVVDRLALAPGQAAKLLPIEYGPSGPFARLNSWLDAHMHCYGFFRPYHHDRGGVAPEPWHLSYAPVAERALERLTVAVLRAALEEGAVAGKAQLLNRLEDIHRRYVASVDSPPPPSLA